MKTDTETKFKSFAITKAKANAAADIDIINQYSMKTLTPEDVFVFSVVLSNNDVDRDMECFSDKSLDTLAELLTGKTGIMDHCQSAKNQIARLYRVEVESTGEMNSLGKPLKQIRGSAYMLRTEDNQPMIDAIEGGIVKEVSISFQVKRLACSICDEDLAWDWMTYTCHCRNGHIKGSAGENGEICVGVLEEPTDAYEFSFVAVPANRKAGVAKGFTTGTSVHEAFLQMSAEQLSKFPEANEAVIKHLQTAMQSAAEREKRAAIRKFAEEIYL